MYDVELGLYIDGQWRAGEGRRTLPVVNPATEEVLAHLPLASEQDIADALASAQEGFDIWRTVSAWDRQVVMNRAADLIQVRRENLAHVLTLENGKPLADARGEIDRVVETIKWCAEEGKRAYGRLLPPRQPELVQTTVKRPIGPVAAFAPWNFPAVLVARKVAAALAAGCSVVVKPAEETPGVCVGVIRAFIDAGLPKGVINMLFGEPSQVSDRLIASSITRKVSFTGSVSVGRLLSTLAAKQLKPVTMELGGHSPVVVFDDVDLQAVARACAGFKFRNAGQVCVSASRFFVHERVYEEFTRHFVEFANAVKVGNGLEAGISMGPLANARRLESTMDLVADAKERGATVYRPRGSRWRSRVQSSCIPARSCATLTCIRGSSRAIRNRAFCKRNRSARSRRSCRSATSMKLCSAPTVWISAWRPTPSPTQSNVQLQFAKASMPAGSASTVLPPLWQMRPLAAPSKAVSVTKVALKGWMLTCRLASSARQVPFSP